MTLLSFTGEENRVRCRARGAVKVRWLKKDGGSSVQSEEGFGGYSTQLQQITELSDV